MRKGTVQLNVRIADWVLFSLPDGLWIFSYVGLILPIRKNSILRNNIISDTGQTSAISKLIYLTIFY
ncbi:MAG: hypothetical protein DSY83_00790 [Flavobacteriia bacterium]|nr:MAG: hypothetical protein DSY83_00790 [Flavobacteriia bacterium]